MESPGLKIVQDGNFFCFDVKCKCGEPGLYVDVLLLAKEIDAALKDAVDSRNRWKGRAQLLHAALRGQG